jgi:L-lactate permease
MVEGASGFGTPVALGAPMLISTGHPKFQSVVVLLVFNTFATVWGAVGTPIWFGFGGIATEEEFVEISYKSGVALAIGAFILVPFTITVLVPRIVVKKNIVFIMLSLVTVVGPSLAISFGSYEFPALIGGMIGCGLTGVLIKFRLGLAPLDPEDMPDRDPNEIGTVSERSIVAEYRAMIASTGACDYNEHGDGEKETAPSKAATAQLEIGTSDEKAEKENGTPSTQQVPEESKEVSVEDVQGGEDDDPEMDAKNADAQGSEIRPGTGHVDSVEDYVDRVLGPRKPFGTAYVCELFGRTFPIWGVVVLLIITRLEQIGLKSYLTLREPYFEIVFGTYGNFRLSASLVFQLIDILTYPGLNWRYELLYTPFLIPFVVISLITMFMYRTSMTGTSGWQVCSTVAGRLKDPFIALLGALSLVQLLIRVSTASPAYILGTTLAAWFRQGFVVIAPLLGALGSFFSGSTTVSNLTFGAVQSIAAEQIGISKTSMLALQAVGGSAGNGICLNNIISACTITGLKVGEGTILAKTYRFVFSNTTIATIVMLAFFIRFN